MAVNPQPNPNDLLTAFFRSVDDLRRNEELAGQARLLALLLACLFIGLAGSAFVGKRFMVSGSWLLHSLWFLAPAVIGITLAIISLGQFVTRMYGLRSLWHGIQYVISTTFGLGGTMIIAQHGEIEVAEESEAASEIGGPGTLSVKSGTAVVTERGSGFARMLGPGQWHLHSFERICSVIDLRTQSSSGNEIALTKDGVPVQVNVSTTLKMAKQMQNEVMPSPQRPGFISVLRAVLGRPAEPGATSLPASPEVLRLATYEIPVPRDPQVKPTWNAAAHSAVSGEVREALARRLLDQLFAPDDLSSRPRQEIGNQVYEAGKAMLAKRGIDLVGLSFDNLIVPPEVDEQRRKTWQVNWEKESSGYSLELTMIPIYSASTHAGSAEELFELPMEDYLELNQFIIRGKPYLFKPAQTKVAGTRVIRLSRDQSYIIVEVIGDSMEPTLRDGEFVLVRRQDYHDYNGQIVVVHSGRQNVHEPVKNIVERIREKTGGIWLESDNPKYGALQASDTDAQYELLGVVVGIFSPAL